jgi:MORN repeat
MLLLLLLQSYEGDWINGERHGTGTYTYRAAEGMVYTGQWYRYVPSLLSIRVHYGVQHA